jgi:serine/threonine protein kinase
LLGRGIYGTVYLATEVGTTKQLACKIVDLRREAPKLPDREQCHDDKQSKVQAFAKKATGAVAVRKKLMREIEILSKINHVGSFVPYL